MKQIDRVGNNIKPDHKIRQIDRVGVERPINNVEIPINEKDLLLLKEIEDKEYEAKELMFKGPYLKETAMKILEENISHGLYCKSYELLSEIYTHRKEYDKAIDILKKGMQFFEKENLEVPPRLLRLLEHTEYSKNSYIFAENFEKGKKLEKKGDIDGAIKIYLENINFKADTPHCYERLYILYRKKKDYKSEIDIIKSAIEIFTEKGFDHSYINKLKNRLEKTEKLYEKYKGQTKLM